MSIFVFKTYEKIDNQMIDNVLRDFDAKLQLPYKGNLDKLLGKHVKDIKFLGGGTYGAVFDCELNRGDEENKDFHHYVLKVNFFTKEKNFKRLDESSNCESIL